MAGALSKPHHKATAGAPTNGARATASIPEATPPATQAPTPWDVDDLYALDALEAAKINVLLVVNHELPDDRRHELSRRSFVISAEFAHNHPQRG